MESAKVTEVGKFPKVCYVWNESINDECGEEERGKLLYLEVLTVPV